MKSIVKEYGTKWMWNNKLKIARLAVPGGWLVKAYVQSPHLTYIPDRLHEWIEIDDDWYWR